MAQAIDPQAEAAPTSTRTTPARAVLIRKPNARAEASIVIEAPIAAVWDYLSDNSKARDWSVYFHHISTLDAAAQTRRCFMNPDEKGKRWDERVVGAVQHRARHIEMYNMVDYKVPGIETHRYDVYQLYEALDENRTRLTFRTAPVRGAGTGQHLIWLLARRKTRVIFELNLENIKAAIEQGDAYQRLHTWPFLD